MKRSLSGTLLAWTVLLFGIGQAVSWTSESGPRSTHVETYFELKFLARGRIAFRPLRVDQWAGGRLEMRALADPSGDGVRLELSRPLEDPWIFRWYDAKDEVKLGAAVSVPDPQGDPYHALRERLEPLARAKHRQWWDADRVEPTAPRRPTWAARTDRFWSERHRDEERFRDPLHRDPVYPFHVLGDPTGRFTVRLRPDGSVVRGSVADRMSEPWLRDGWAGWQAGRKRPGYGYWDRTDRPDWEPRTYQTLAAALELMDWACGDAGGSCAIEEEPGEFAARLAGVVETLNPKLEGRLRWRRPVQVGVRSVTERDSFVETIAGTAKSVEGEGDSGPRVWRYTRRAAGGRVVQDELQVLVEDLGSPSFKLWLVVGYRE